VEILKIKQKTPEWYKWRNTVIGASDSPAILGLPLLVNPSQYQTPWDVWESKVYNIVKENKWIFQKGDEIESRVRARYELDHNDCPPVVMQEGIFGASLDGWNGDTVLEIKFVGRDHVDTCPPHHYAQLMHQLYVSKAKKLIYLPCDGERVGHMEFTFDKDWWKKNVTILKRFWRDVEKKRLSMLQQTGGEVLGRSVAPTLCEEGTPQEASA